jgi:eukaryotic-like serine/threonine-protein kinase
MVLQDGDKLQNGKYTVEKYLGQGRFTITYLVSKSDGDRRVIKILNPQVLAELAMLVPPEADRLRGQFWKEAVNLARCNGSPHIVQVDTPFEEKGVYYLPMEYIEGNSLADRNPRVMSEELALRYIRQIGEALALVHANGLIHCDIRPANIFLRSRDGVQEAVLADFGLALDSDTKLTRTREREQMDGFSAPELYTKDRPIGAYTDVYSLAATLHDLVTGVPPIGANKRSSFVDLESPRIKNPDVSAATTKAILRGLEMRRRSDSVAAWLTMLPVVKSVVSTEMPGQKKSQLNWQTFWMAAAVVVAFFALIVAALGIVPGWLTWLEIKPAAPTKTLTPAPLPRRDRGAGQVQQNSY